MTALLRTGARINQVDEEGEVTVFCYSLGRSFSFRVDGNEEARRWGALLGKGITVQILDEEYDADLYECAACTAKPGFAVLCHSCVERRKKAGPAWRGQRPSQSNSEGGGEEP